jgi:ABC-type phosphate transport system permease subunit
MKKNMINNFKNWHFTRIIRLIAGIGSLIYGVIGHDQIFLILAALFLVQSFFNLSCCGNNGCTTTQSTDNKQVYKDIIKPLKLK